MIGFVTGPSTLEERTRDGPLRRLLGGAGEPYLAVALVRLVAPQTKAISRAGLGTTRLSTKAKLDGDRRACPLPMQMFLTVGRVQAGIALVFG